MTLRLVALMSVVLLLSLAAFGLLMSHYQDQVMQEVARTASAVGRATLRTLDLERALPHDPIVRDAAGNHFVWHTQTELDRPVGENDAEDERRMVVVRRFEGAGTHVIEDFSEVRKVRFGPSESAEFAGVALIESPGLPEDARECLAKLAAARGPGSGGPDEMFIDLENVKAVKDPVHGNLVLTIRAFSPVLEHIEAGQEHPVELEEELRTTIDVAAGITELVSREIQMPISMDDYETLFQSIRRRSLYLFVGVFLLGMVLTGGVAARFTRPIRKLDSGIRRLSDGDLDVHVEVQGKDEVARLGLAFNDMTAKLRANRDRSREMVRREKLSALGGLAAGVAHDVRNPLHSIGLTLQHLTETCRPEAEERAEEFDRSLEMIRGEIRRLDQLVGNFLRFARSDRRERQPVDLADLLRETARLIKKEAEWRGVDVRLDLLETAPAVSADGEALRSSILNLVLNSFEAMSDGGTLTLALRVEGESIVVQVEDTGQGIPEEDRERVFEFAYSTREAGNGLGLAMVHHCVVEEHGGRIALDSQPGQGTRVSMALPIRPPERDERA